MSKKKIHGVAFTRNSYVHFYCGRTFISFEDETPPPMTFGLNDVTCRRCIHSVGYRREFRKQFEAKKKSQVEGKEAEK